MKAFLRLVGIAFPILLGLQVIAGPLDDLRKKAEEGDAEAQHNLGLAYAEGDGVPEDHVEAFKWIRKAAHQGFALAQSSLGVAYAEGSGVPSDDVEAYKWINLAAGAGDAKAISTRRLLESRMTAAQITEARRLCWEFSPQKTTPSDDGPGSVGGSKLVR
jgi:hypothetical protein